MDTPRWFLSWTQLGSAGLTWTHLRSTAFRCRRGGCNNNPLALGGKETKDDEWHNYWTPASFESLKSVCFLRTPLQGEFWQGEARASRRARAKTAYGYTPLVSELDPAGLSCADLDSPALG